MSEQNLYNVTKRRLADYKLFSEQTVEVVATLAQKQAGYATYQEYFATQGGVEPALHLRTSRDGVPYVDVPAKGKRPKGTLVVHLPMANPLDPNQRFQIATIADSNPEYRVIGFGNPSHKPYKYRQQNQTAANIMRIATRKNKRPLVAAELDYLEKQGIDGAVHIGYSYGAHKALIAANYTPGAQLEGLVLVDPVAHARSVRQLVDDFLRTFAPLGEYVNRTKLQIFLDARNDSHPTESHNKKYLRPINVAIGLLLARVDFIPFLKEVIQHKPAPVAVAWGVKSELGNDAHLRTSLNQLAKAHAAPVQQFRLPHDSHAFANDIYLHAAIVREALTASSKRNP